MNWDPLMIAAYGGSAFILIWSIGWGLYITLDEMREDRQRHQRKQSHQ